MAEGTSLPPTTRRRVACYQAAGSPRDIARDKERSICYRGQPYLKFGRSYQQHLRMVNVSTKGCVAAEVCSMDRREEKQPQSSDIDKRIIPEDLNNASRKIIKLVQRQTFNEEITKLAKGLATKSNRLARLKLILDGEHILRVGGRISRAPISRDAANPMILPRKHHVTRIFIRFFHERNGHCGDEQVLALSRERCWILKGCAAIKEVLNGCIKCKRRTAVRQAPEIGRTAKGTTNAIRAAFSYTGVDYFGPLYVKRGRGKTTEKCWGVIFTCMDSRAVHLEVARSLETNDFILVLIGFLNRRGHVKEICSDNGTNFVGAEREIQDAIKQVDKMKLNNELSMRGCKWSFIHREPHTCPEFGKDWYKL